MTTKEKLLTFIAGAELALCFLLAALIALEVNKPIIVNVTDEKSGSEIELVDKALEYLQGQIDYYEYNLAGLKAYDEQRGFYY